jgi:hypothetical protein
MNDKGKCCPKWHHMFYLFKGEHYSKVADSTPHADPRYTKWVIRYHCIICGEDVEIDKLKALNKESGK